MNTFKFKQQAVGIFITAFYPNRSTFVDLLLELQEKEIAFIEIGIPYSDPIADGPVIQNSSEIAIAAGFSVQGLFDLLLEHKGKLVKPLVLMGYGNQVLQYGIQRFVSQCKNVPIQGLIFPDLPLEIMQLKHPDLLHSDAIPFIHLVTPNTEDERIKLLAQASKNSFIYLVGSSKTTGSSYQLDKQLERYRKIKELCEDTPVFLGFGIDSKAKKALAFGVVDGIIVGSAYLKAVEENRQHEFLDDLISC